MRVEAKTYKEKTNLLEKDHDWFAWYPVKIESGDWIWMETVKRRLLFRFIGPSIWVYKDGGNETTTPHS